MKKIIIITIFCFLFTIAVAQALVLETGTNYTYQNGANVYFTVLNDLNISTLQVLSDRIVLNNHNIIFQSPFDLYIEIDYWDGYNHSFNIYSDVEQSIDFSILVNGQKNLILSESIYYEDYFFSNSTSKQWVYTSGTLTDNSLDYLTNLTLELLNTYDIEVFGGNDYQINEDGRIFVQLLNNDTGLNNATCNLDVYYPSTVYNATNYFLNNVSMNNFYDDGLFYYDFTVPNTTGIYMINVECDIGEGIIQGGGEISVRDYSFDELLSIPSIVSYLQNINTTVTSIDGTTTNIESIVNDTNSRIILLNNSVYDIEQLLQAMNITLSNIYDIASSINSTVVSIQGTVGGIESVVLEINTTLVTIENNQIQINSTINNIESIVLNTSNDLDYLINLTSSLNLTATSYLSEFLLIQELINNQTDLFIIAFTDISYFDDVNISDYIGNHTLETRTIVETLPMEFSLQTLQDPLEGETYRVNYYFFEKDTGELASEQQIEVIGQDTHEIIFSDSSLTPDGLQGDYEVWVRIEMLNGDGFWQSFPLYRVDTLTVNALTNNGGTPKLYDLTVETVFQRYDTDEIITADIVVLNKGERTEKDSLLTYWLESPTGERFGERTEQLDSLERGYTLFTRSISLPSGTIEGDWQFVAEFESITQPKVVEYDEFNLISGFSIFDRAYERLPIIYKRNLAISWIGIIALVILLLTTRLVVKNKSKPRRNKYKDDVLIHNRNE